MRAAYHLGNRHVALQLGDGWLRLPDDYVLKAMLEQLGAPQWKTSSALPARARCLRRRSSPLACRRCRIQLRAALASVRGAQVNPAWQLLRLASPQLPIGGYSYSQGLEMAVEQCLVR